jgi:hypothetical protein
VILYADVGALDAASMPTVMLQEAARQIDYQFPSDYLQLAQAKVADASRSDLSVASPSEQTCRVGSDNPTWQLEMGRLDLASGSGPSALIRTYSEQRVVTNGTNGIIRRQ